MPQVMPWEKTDVLMKAAHRAMRFWGLTDEQVERLCGVSPDALSMGPEHFSENPFPVKTWDMLSMIASIYSELHHNFGEDVADTWPAAINENPVFEGASPLEFMLQGGTPAASSTLMYLRSRTRTS